MFEEPGLVWTYNNRFYSHDPRGFWFEIFPNVAVNPLAVFNLSIAWLEFELFMNRVCVHMQSIDVWVNGKSPSRYYYQPGYEGQPVCGLIRDALKILNAKSDARRNAERIAAEAGMVSSDDDVVEIAITPSTPTASPVASAPSISPTVATVFPKKVVMVNMDEIEIEVSL
jgi:hypothetical protein